MCDTFAIGREFTSSGNLVFAKNSDREPDEAQVVVSLPRKEDVQGQSLRCTYVTIPQGQRSNAILLCKPFWIWGAEMGVNENGVVIGNEALFTKVKPEKNPGLIGMDLLRLGLERSATADEALEVIIDLLRRYGQGGACGYRDKGFAYMNSYLLMDRKEIIILETVGRDYAVKKRKDFAAISNKITISDDWERSNLERGTDFQSYSDTLISFFSGSSQRKGQVEGCIRNHAPKLGLQEVFGILRGHNGSHPFDGFNRDVCMHASDPFIRKSHTTGSLVVELDSSSGFRAFVTAGSTPCLTPFKPILPGEMPEGIDRGGPRYASDSYWWRHKQFCVFAEMRLSKVADAISKEIREIELYYCMNMPLHQWNETDELLHSKSREAFIRSSMLDDKWLQKMKRIEKDPHLVHNTFWSMLARRNGLFLS